MPSKVLVWIQNDEFGKFQGGISFKHMQDISLQEPVKTKSMCVVLVVQVCLCFE